MRFLPVVRRCSRGNHCQSQRLNDPLPTSPTMLRFTSSTPLPVWLLVDYIRICIYVCMYLYAFIWIIYSYALMRLCIYVLYAFTCMRLRTRVLMSVCTYVFMCIPMCYLHTYLHSQYALIYIRALLILPEVIKGRRPPPPRDV